MTGWKRKLSRATRELGGRSSACPGLWAAGAAASKPESGGLAGHRVCSTQHLPLGPRLGPAPGPVSTRPLLSVCLSSGTTAGGQKGPEPRTHLAASSTQGNEGRGLRRWWSRVPEQIGRGRPGGRGKRLTSSGPVASAKTSRLRLQGASSQQGGRTRCSESDATTSPSGKLCLCLRAQPHLHAPQTPRRQLRAHTSSLCPSRLPGMQTKPVPEARGWESASPEAPAPPSASCQRCLQAVRPASCPRPGQGPPCPLAWATQEPPNWEHAARSDPTSYP